MPSNKLFSEKIWHYDKIGHFGMFFAWTFLYGIVQTLRKKHPANLWVAFLTGCGFGISIEILQYYLPINRSPDAYDILADSIGAGLAVLLLKPTLSTLLKRFTLTA